MPPRARLLKAPARRGNGMNEEIKRYSMIIEWDDDDKIYVVTVPELPGCMTHGHTYEEAIQQG
jgi:hypothetical protein